MKFFCFLTDDLPTWVLEDHQRCCRHIGLRVDYRIVPTGNFDDIYTGHGLYLNECLEATEDVACFIDIDALPHSIQTLNACYQWVTINQSFLGNAQNISHTPLRNRIYAAASMLMVSKEAWTTLGRPNLAWHYSAEGLQIDTAQSLSLAADSVGFPYRTLYPLGYDSSDKCYDLGGFGEYGTGTLYPAVWHYFRVSALKGIDRPKIWEKRVKDILAGRPIAPKKPSQFWTRRSPAG